MARSTRNAPVVDTETETAEVEATAEATPKQVINEAIGRVVEATGTDVQKNRYKAMRAIAYQAFVEAIDSGDFDGLVDRAIANVDNLPAGWEIERGEKAAEPAKPTRSAKAKPEPTSQSNVQKAAATRKPRATKAKAAEETEGEAKPARRRPAR